MRLTPEREATAECRLCIARAFRRGRVDRETGTSKRWCQPQHGLSNAQPPRRSRPDPKVARTNDREVYEHDYGYPQHDHLICKKCGEMIEFPNEVIAEVLERVAAEHGFRMSGHRLEVEGIWRKLLASPSRRAA